MTRSIRGVDIPIILYSPEWPSVSAKLKPHSKASTLLYATWHWSENSMRRNSSYSEAGSCRYHVLHNVENIVTDDETKARTCCDKRREEKGIHAFSDLLLTRQSGKANKTVKERIETSTLRKPSHHRSNCCRYWYQGICPRDG